MDDDVKNIKRFLFIFKVHRLIPILSYWEHLRINTPLIDFIIYEKLFSIIYFQSKPMTRSICTTGFKNYPGSSLFIQVSEVWYAIIYCGTFPHIIFLLSLLTISCLPISYFLLNFGVFRQFLYQFKSSCCCLPPTITSSNEVGKSDKKIDSFYLYYVLLKYVIHRLYKLYHYFFLSTRYFWYTQKTSQLWTIT